MNITVKDALYALRQHGYAIIIFTPDELNGMDPRDLEEGLVSHANNNLLPVDNEDDD